MKFLKYSKKQRAYDGKWEVIGMYAVDEDAYHYVDEHGKNAVLPAYKWVTVRVETEEPRDIRNG
jgi:hypothetical protein